MKRIFALLLIVVFVICLFGCNIKQNNIPENQKTTVVTTTEQVTKIYNHFKDRLPGFKFKNEIEGVYDESLKYSFSVESSEREFKKYVNALEKAGFEVNPSSGTGYYAAVSEDSYHVEAALIENVLNVTIKKI